MKKFALGAGLVLFLCVVLFAQQYECPPCDLSQIPMTGAGTGSDGRPIANVYIDSSWDIDQNGHGISGTNSNIWNATCAGSPGSGCSTGQGPSAIAMWNNAQFGSNVSPWAFQVNQSFTSHSDVIIQRVDNPTQGCANNETGTRVPNTNTALVYLYLDPRT